MLSVHEKKVRAIFAEFASASAKLSAAVKEAFPVGSLIEVRRPKVTISGRVIGYSPSNPREVWFLWETNDRRRGQHDRFQVMHDAAKVTRYAL